MTKTQKLVNRLNEDFRTIIAAKMLERYGVQIETTYNLLSGNVVSTRLDEREFTDGQVEWLRAFEDGFTTAMKIVREEALR